MRFLSPLLAASIASASSLQNPLVHTEDQAPLFKKELVNSDDLQADISQANLLKRAKELYSIAELGIDEYNHPTRVIGSEGHLGTIEYIHRTLNNLGGYYNVTNQSFPAIVGNVFESRLNIGSDTPESATAMALTPPTKNREPVTGPLIKVENDGCELSDYPSDVEGGIAFIRRGVCPFGTKSENAGKAGAKAAVIYNNVPGTASGTLGTPSKWHVATFALSQEDAIPVLMRLEAGGEVDTSAYIDAVVKLIGTKNVIAQTVGGDPENCVMLGGHSDSVPEGPGINDDGSGSLTLLEIATQLAKYRVNNCVRFAWWAGEEEGLLGSDWYVAQLDEEENMKIRLFMDFDMLGSPNFAYQIYNATDMANPLGSEELRDLYIDWYQANGLNHTFVPFDGRSDYVAFIMNGIPGGGVATGAEGIKTQDEAEMFGGRAGDWYDPCYHQLCDGIGNVNLTAWTLNTRLVAHSVATFARSFDGFPKRVSIKSLISPDILPYHGSKLVM